MEKLLSISIASYNVEKFLRETLDSLVVPEKMDLLEVLIVDDGSKDNTAAIATEYSNKYPDTFKLISKENGGWGSTVNTGITSATGKYFKLLDGDDSFNTADMPAFIDLLASCEADMVYTNYITFDDETNETLSTIKVDDRLPLGETVSADNLNEDYRIMMHACTFRTDLLKAHNVGVTEHCFYTDNEYVVKALCHIKTVCMADLTIYRYRIGREGQSVSWAGYRKHYEDHIKVTEELLSVYKNFNGSEKLKKVLFNRVMWIVDVQYDVMLHLGKDKKYKDALMKYDKDLKDNYPEFYRTDRSRIKALRMTKGIMYPWVIYKD